MTGGEVTASLTNFFIPYSASLDLCKELSCPLSQGSHNFKFQQVIPSVVPEVSKYSLRWKKLWIHSTNKKYFFLFICFKGKYNVKMEGKDDNGLALFCAALTVEVIKKN